jgi:LPS-assembly lipoprotein
MKKAAAKIRIFTIMAFLSTALSLSACGFTPLYSQNAQVSAHLDQIQIGIIPDRSGQFLRNALIDRFYQTGTPSAPLYHLKIEPIAESISDLDITKSSDATRAQLRLRTTMTLTDTATGNAVLTRQLRSITSYNILQSQFTTNVSEQDARESGLNDLARQIERQISLHLKKASF